MTSNGSIVYVICICSELYCSYCCDAIPLHFVPLLICCQDSEELLAYSEGASGSMSLPSGFRPQRGPLSPWLVVHFHGGGFVAQTSKSHEVCVFTCLFDKPALANMLCPENRMSQLTVELTGTMRQYCYNLD